MDEKKLGLRDVVAVSVGLVIATSSLVSLGQGAGRIGGRAQCADAEYDRRSGAVHAGWHRSSSNHGADGRRLFRIEHPLKRCRGVNLRLCDGRGDSPSASELFLDAPDQRDHPDRESERCGHVREDSEPGLLSSAGVDADHGPDRGIRSGNRSGRPRSSSSRLS